MRHTATAEMSGAIDRLQLTTPVAEMRAGVHITELWTPDGSVYNGLTMPLKPFADNSAARPGYFRGIRSGEATRYRVAPNFKGYLLGNVANVGRLQQRVVDSSGGVDWADRSLEEVAGNLLDGDLLEGMRTPGLGIGDLPESRQLTLMTTALQATADAVVALSAERSFISAERKARSGVVGARYKVRPDRSQLHEQADTAFLRYLAALRSQDNSSWEYRRQSAEELGL